MKNLLPRKMVTASFASCLFAVAYALFNPDPLNTEMGSYLYRVWLIIPAYLLYALPIMFTFGIAASLASQWITRKFLSHLLTAEVQQTAALLTLHVIFGSVFLYAGLLGALIFFVLDFLFARRGAVYTYKHAMISLLGPFGLFALLIITYWLSDLTQSL